METNALVCSKLALERCKSYIDQIHAVIYLCRDDNHNINKTAADNVQRIAGLLDMELQASYDLLTIPE
jgi:hypothetical protein